MNDEIGLDIFKREFETYSIVIDDLLTDIEYSKSNKIYYNLDFAILFPWLWPIRPQSVPPFKPFGRRVFDMLTEIKHLNPKFRLVFSGPSFWELLDSILHQVNYWESLGYSARAHHEKILSLLKDEAHFDKWHDMLIKAGFAVEELEALFNKPFDYHIRIPIQRAIDLFSKEAVLLGLGDVVSYQGKINKVFREQFQSLFQRMLSVRGQKEMRGEIDRAFHYKVDSANIITSTALNMHRSDFKVYFTSPSDIRDRYCHEDGRNPLVPYYWISSLLLKKNKIIDSPVRFLTMMLDRANEINKALSDLVSLDESDYLKASIIDFYRTFVLPLKNAKKSSKLVTTSEQREIFKELVSDPKKFEKRFYEAKEELTEGSKQLVQLQGDMLEDGLYEVIGGDEDPVIKKIRKKFKI